MTREDYVDLIELLTGILEMEIPDLSDPSLYTERDSESGELLQRSPRDHFLELLYALERHLAVNDRTTYERALRIINESSEGPSVLGAAIIPLDDSAPQGFEMLPDLRSVRRQLAELIQEILADTDPNGEVNR